MNREEFIKSRQKGQLPARKNTTVSFSVTIEELERIKEAAEKLNITQSDYLRMRLFYES